MKAARSAFPAAAFFVPLAVYVFSMQRNVGFWDVGEMQTVPYILGIAHPTGFPVFTLAGWAFSHAVPLGSVAWRMTCFSALAMSGAAYVVALIVEAETGDAVVATLAGWFFAFSDLAWNRGTRTEVHALSTFLIAATLYFMLRWARTRDVRALWFAGAAWGLALGTHPVAALLGIGLLILLLVHWETLPMRSLAGACALCAAIVVVAYAYLPVRSAQVYAQRRDPTLALGVAPGRPFWDYDHPSSLAGFTQLVTGSEFPVGDGLAAVFSPETYVQHGGRYLGDLTSNFTLAGALLAFAGAVIFLLRARLRAAGFIVAGAFGAPFALGFPIEADVARYFLPSFVVAAVLGGIAVAAPAARFPRMRVLTVLAFLLVVGVEAYDHSSLMGQRFDPGATNFIAFVTAHTEANAILMAPWTYATPLAYAAYVDGSLGGRVVETAWLSDDIEELPRWMHERPVYIVYLPWGDLPAGYRLQQVPGGDPPLYRVLQKRP